MHINNIRIRSKESIVPYLISDCINKHMIGFKTFKYIAKNIYTGCQTEKRVYTIVNFVIEKVLENYPVEYIGYDYELYVKKEQVTLVTSDMVDIYRIDTNLKRLEKLKMPEEYSKSYFINDNIKFDIEVQAYTLNPGNIEEVNNNILYHRNAFSDYMPIFNNCAHFNNETENILSYDTSMSISSSFKLLVYMIDQIITLYETNFNPQDYLLSGNNTYEDEMFPFIKAAADSSLSVFQVSDNFKCTIQTRPNEHVKFDVDKLMYNLKEYKELVLKLNNNFLSSSK